MGAGGGGGVEIGDIIEGPGENPDGEGPGEGPGEGLGEGPGEGLGERQVDHLLKEFKTNVFDIIPEGLHTMNPPFAGPVAVVPDGHDPDLIAKDPF
jgi:hypothetical protein